MALFDVTGSCVEATVAARAPTVPSAIPDPGAGRAPNHPTTPTTTAVVSAAATRTRARGRVLGWRAPAPETGSGDCVPSPLPGGETAGGSSASCAGGGVHRRGPGRGERGPGLGEEVAPMAANGEGRRAGSIGATGRVGAVGGGVDVAAGGVDVAAGRVDVAAWGVDVAAWGVASSADPERADAESTGRACPHPVQYSDSVPAALRPQAVQNRARSGVLMRHCPERQPNQRARPRPLELPRNPPSAHPHVANCRAGRANSVAPGSAWQS